MTKQSTIYVLGIALLLSVSVNLLSFKKSANSKPDFTNAVVKVENGCTDPCEKPYPGLPYGIAKRMIDNYGNKQYSYITEKGTIDGRRTAGTTYNFTDARNVYYDLDTIKQFICTIENIVAEKQLINSKGAAIKKCDLGVKIYYAAYPGGKEIYTWKGMSPTYAGKHTVVFVATYRDFDGTVKAFDPASSKKRTQPYTAFKLLNPNSNVIMLASASVNVNEANPLIRNHGTLCPPPANCPMEDELLR